MTATIETEFLQGIALDEAPPCQTKKGHTLALAQLCGEPSVVRVHVKCACGATGHMFLCQECYDIVRSGGTGAPGKELRCPTCLRVNSFTWASA